MPDTPAERRPTLPPSSPPPRPPSRSPWHYSPIMDAHGNCRWREDEHGNLVRKTLVRAPSAPSEAPGLARMRDSVREAVRGSGAELDEDAVARYTQRAWDAIFPAASDPSPAIGAKEKEETKQVKQEGRKGPEMSAGPWAGNPPGHAPATEPPGPKRLPYAGRLPPCPHQVGCMCGAWLKNPPHASEYTPMADPHAARAPFAPEGRAAPPAVPANPWPEPYAWMSAPEFAGLFAALPGTFLTPPGLPTPPATAPPPPRGMPAFDHGGALERPPFPHQLGYPPHLAPSPTGLPHPGCPAHSHASAPGAPHVPPAPPPPAHHAYFGAPPSHHGHPAHPGYPPAPPAPPGSAPPPTSHGQWPAGLGAPPSAPAPAPAPPTGWLSPQLHELWAALPAASRPSRTLTGVLAEQGGFPGGGQHYAGPNEPAGPGAGWQSAAPPQAPVADWTPRDLPFFRP